MSSQINRDIIKRWASTSVTMDFVAYLKMVTTRDAIGKKAIRREGHGNSITVKDFGDQFSRNSLDGKSHSPYVPSDGGR